mmetsp:Transcript_51754/g.123170  ORF Transcript_51754/g.123170 Transcript_51754/m.123170 type:complete len:199 (-) Transcript_51754:87-683(-)
MARTRCAFVAFCAMATAKTAVAAFSCNVGTLALPVGGSCDDADVHTGVDIGVESQLLQFHSETCPPGITTCQTVTFSERVSFDCVIAHVQGSCGVITDSGNECEEAEAEFDSEGKGRSFTCESCSDEWNCNPTADALDRAVFHARKLQSSSSRSRSRTSAPNRRRRTNKASLATGANPGSTVVAAMAVATSGLTLQLA